MRMSIGVRRWHFRAGWRLSPSPDAQQAGRGRLAERGRARPACGSSSSGCALLDAIWPRYAPGGGGERERTLCVPCLCVSASPCPPCLFVRVRPACERERVGVGCVCARVGWMALVVDDRPVWDWATSACGLTIDNDRATLGPKFSASGPRRRHAPTRLGRAACTWACWLAGLLSCLLAC